MLKPLEPERPEPIEAIVNQGEFPTLTDQGEEQAYPQPPAPKKRKPRAATTKK